ncbi:hypothetical protein ACFQ0B_44935 [Nonomuraea thailandensis]
MGGRGRAAGRGGRGGHGARRGHGPPGRGRRRGLPDHTGCAARGDRGGRRLGVPVLPGAFTPTEIVQAWSQGAAMVKVFPAGAAGGPGYVRDVRAPLPQIPLVPTGGIRIEDVPGYLQVGARAVGMGSPLLGEACADGDTAALAARAERLVEIAGRRGPDG